MTQRTSEPLVTERVEFCPECHRECLWCSANAIMCRAVGCATMFPKLGKCDEGNALKGTTCGTCDGSGKVRVRREILGAA